MNFEEAQTGFKTDGYQTAKAGKPDGMT